MKKRGRPIVIPDILSDADLRRLIRNGTLVPFNKAPSVPPRPAILAELRARLQSRTRVESAEPGSEDVFSRPDHRGRLPGDPLFMNDD